MNPWETYACSGHFGVDKLPFTPGSDCSGVVVRAGTKVTKLKVCLIKCLLLCVDSLILFTCVVVYYFFFFCVEHLVCFSVFHTNVCQLAAMHVIKSDLLLLQCGDRVYTVNTVTGSYAEYAVANEHHVFKLHDALSFSQGAALGVPYFTAYRALFYV